MRVWCREMTDSIPSGINVTAAIGFKMLGENVVYYRAIDDVLDRITRDDIVVDGVQQTRRVFGSLNIMTRSMDYPPVLFPFLERKIWNDKIGRVRRFAEYPVFVKPVREKLFTGKVIRSVSDWAPLVHVALSEPVYCGEVIDIRSEYRVFIRYDRILDVRPYHGDYHYQFDPEQLDRMLAAYVSWEDRPHAGAIDIAVTGDRKTVFLEFNDGYSLGTYGLEPSVYARFLAARWKQLMDVPDPYAMDGFEI